MTPGPTCDVAVLVRMPQELRDALTQRADDEDRSLASLLRMAARRYLATDSQGRS